MSVNEMLKVHAEIEMRNERKQQQWQRRQIVKKFYPQFCREGKFDEARLLLRLLRHGTISLGLDDASSCVESLLDKLGFKPYYNRNYNIARYTL